MMSRSCTWSHYLLHIASTLFVGVYAFGGLLYATLAAIGSDLLDSHSSMIYVPACNMELCAGIVGFIAMLTCNQRLMLAAVLFAASIAINESFVWLQNFAMVR
jgi:hypothetical protein